MNAYNAKFGTGQLDVGQITITNERYVSSPILLFSSITNSFIIFKKPESCLKVIIW